MFDPGDSIFDGLYVVVELFFRLPSTLSGSLSSCNRTDKVGVVAEEQFTRLVEKLLLAELFECR